MEKGYFKTLSEAKKIIMTGQVLVNDKVIDKPGSKCEHSSRIRIKYTKKKLNIHIIKNVY